MNEEDNALGDIAAAFEAVWDEYAEEMGYDGFTEIVERKVWAVTQAHRTTTAADFLIRHLLRRLAEHEEES